ncbi:hypothetical protein COLO4_03432 [Corchorus olitorius]|uniref:Uncharacterized protein n=1 Tax=Corchorus olitorius TaxID=93759 RepID=A0A1R3KYQ4_9ROSI|nr:hypothetical protein COLO4_03432 [Corchorus olitorius]
MRISTGSGKKMNKRKRKLGGNCCSKRVKVLGWEDEVSSLFPVVAELGQIARASLP